ncbi:MAG: hypothetical protein ACK4UX_02040 [Thiobacillus sp.]
MLALSLPGTDPVLQQRIETRPKAVAEWLAGLPFATPLPVAQQLVMALYALNRHALADDDRAELLALYRPAVARAAASLEDMITDAGLPPPPLQRQAGAMLRELRIEFGTGCRHVLQGLATRRLVRAGAKRVAEAAARALVASCDILYACALTRTIPPAGLWREIHQIYAYAQACSAADLGVDDAPAPTTAYVYAVLFARADPPHLSHAELVHTRLYLDKYARRAVLSAVSVRGHSGFAVPIHGDAAPSPAAGGTPQETLWLDTDVLCKHLEAIMLHLRTGDTPSRLRLPEGMQSETTELLAAHLRRQWCAGPQRAFRRHTPADKTVRAVSGLAAIHALLDAGRPPLVAGMPPEVPPRAAAVAPARWSVANDSAAGLALTGSPDASASLRVGDPIALREDPDAAWSLGVIRWLRMRDPQQVEFGLERISPRIEAVWVRPLRGHASTAPQRSLFVPGVTSLKQADRLLLPRHLYQLGIEAEVTHGGRTYLIAFGKRTDPAPGFDLIDFTIFEDNDA